MSNKKTKTCRRKDSKGRFRRTGEYKRADGSYEYRFTDQSKKRVSINAHSGYEKAKASMTKIMSFADIQPLKCMKCLG